MLSCARSRQWCYRVRGAGSGVIVCQEQAVMYRVPGAGSDVIVCQEQAVMLSCVTSRP